MNLLLSTDSKPRLKWTSELHRRFVEAVGQLGGAEKATPKSLMRVMGIRGLTLYHLKSHLQKYRLGKSRQAEISIDVKQEDESQNPINESLQMTQTLQIQMEVQRKLHEQIEVQRHLQMRIEAQGKYLQSVLKKAQEALSGYDCSSLEAELTKAELGRLVQMVNSKCASSCLSELTDIECPSKKDFKINQVRSAICSMQSSLTSSESLNEDDGDCEEKNGRKFGGMERLDLNLKYETENEFEQISG